MNGLGTTSTETTPGADGTTANHFRLESLTSVVFVLFALTAIRYQIKLLNYREWMDESETIVTAKMIASGGRLYADIFNHHGPLTFLPGLIVAKFGDFGIAAHRVPIAMLQLVALASIYFSPILSNTFIRKTYTMLAASVMLVYLPESMLFGHMYMYQVIGGLLLVIIFAQLCLPAIACQDRLSMRTVVAGNVLIGSLPFLAVTYVPAAALLFLASTRRRFLAHCCAGLAGGLLLNVVFLASIGSVRGFLAFHIYLNAEILPLYDGGQGGLRLLDNAFNSVTGNLFQFSIFAITTVAISRLTRIERGIPWRSISVWLCLGSLLIRGIFFHELPYLYCALVIPLVFFLDESAVALQPRSVALAFSIVCLLKVSLLMPEDNARFNSNLTPVSTEFSQLAQILTTKQDRIIAYSFQNFQYIASDRLPASGNFFYLPWQAKYNENPKFGIRIDACHAIRLERPKLMLIDKWKVFDKFTWESYATCIQDLLDKYYSQVPGRPYYIRKDLFPEDMGLVFSDEPIELRPSAELSSGMSIGIAMTPSHQRQQAPLKRVGVMFETYVRSNLGYAVLHLRGPDNAEFVQTFSLSDIDNNKYHYFDLDSKMYTTGEITGVAGGGISTWESHDGKGGVLTCLAYEYSDDRRGFTPGCPLF
jgi:hypothetical protein